MININSTKKYYKVVFFGFLLLSQNLRAQITLDTTIGSTNMSYWFKPVQISSGETKYYLADTVSNTFNLYNMDFSPFLLNIIVPEPFINGNIIFQAIYISRSLFDCDSSNIEYAYESATHGERSFYIMRTDGSQLFKLDSANGPYCFGDCLGGADWVKPIVNTSSGTKLFLQSYSGEINIYSLCGKVPMAFDLVSDKMNQSFVNLFPNPTSNLLTFEIHPPNNMEDFELAIIDFNAKELLREKVNLWNNRLTIDVGSFSNGSYIYTLSTKNKSYQIGKFIINK